MFRTPPPNRVASACAVGCVALLLAACGAESKAASTTAVELAAPTSTGAETTVAATTTQASIATTAAVTTNPPTTVGSTSTAPSADDVTTTEPAAAAKVPNQRAAIEYDHPELGPMTITIAYEDRTEETLLDPTVRATVNATGETVFEWADFGYYYDFGFAANSERNPTITNPVDKRGHVFFEYEPGREPGVEYLVPTDTGFRSGPTPDGVQHLDAHVVDSDGDGNYEIEQGFWVCNPSCAEGYRFTHIWPWDGSAYSGPNDDPTLSADEAAQMDAAEEAFNDYLLAAGAGEYDSAWAMLPQEAQDNFGGFDQFTEFWDGVESVGTISIYPYKMSEPPEPSASTGLDVELWYELTDGTREKETVAAIMTDDDPPQIYEYIGFGFDE